MYAPEGFLHLNDSARVPGGVAKDLTPSSPFLSRAMKSRARCLLTVLIDETGTDS